MPDSKKVVLIVEDNPGDLRIAQEAFKEGKYSVEIQSVSDGIQALEYLKKENEYFDKPTPNIVLLDLNLPRKDGREVLKEVKENEVLKHIPVIILTTSQSEDDIFKCYNLHANCYISKSVDLDEFVESVKSVEEYWFNVAKLPKDPLVN